MSDTGAKIEGVTEHDGTGNDTTASEQLDRRDLLRLAVVGAAAGLLAEAGVVPGKAGAEAAEKEAPVYRSMAEWLKSPEYAELASRQREIEKILGDDKFMTREKGSEKMDQLATLQSAVCHPFPYPESSDLEVRKRIEYARRDIWQMRMPPIAFPSGAAVIENLRTHWNMDIVVNTATEKLLSIHETFRVPAPPANTPVAMLNLLCEKLQLRITMGNGGRLTLEPVAGAPGTLMENPYAYWVQTPGTDFDTIEVTLKNGQPLLHIDPKSYGQSSRRGLRIDTPTKSPEFPLDKRPDGRKTRIDFPGNPSADTGERQELLLHIVTAASQDEALVPLKDEAAFGMQHFSFRSFEDGVFEMEIQIRYPEAWATTQWDEEACLQALALPNEYEYVYTDGTREPATVKSVCPLAANCHDLKITFHPPKHPKKTVKAMYVKGYGAIGEYQLPMHASDTPGVGKRQPIEAPPPVPPHTAPAPTEDPLDPPKAPGFPDLIRKAGRWMRGKFMPGKPEDLPPPRPPLKAD